MAEHRYVGIDFLGLRTRLRKVHVLGFDYPVFIGFDTGQPMEQVQKLHWYKAIDIEEDFFRYSRICVSQHRCTSIDCCHTVHITIRAATKILVVAFNIGNVI